MIFPVKSPMKRIACDNRRFLNAVFWIQRSGAPWRDLPSDYGDWKNTHRVSCVAPQGAWEALLEQRVDDQGVTIEAGHMKIHHDGTGAQGKNEAVSRTKEGLNSKIRLAVDAHGNPLRVVITEGSRADCG